LVNKPAPAEIIDEHRRFLISDFGLRISDFELQRIRHVRIVVGLGKSGKWL
jgi:hypothetical protein